MTRINRILQILNFLGVAALAVLCVVQWHANSQAIAAADQLEQVRQQQAAKLSEQQKTMQNDSAELDDLHQRLSEVQAAVRASKAKMAAMSAGRDALTAKADQFEATLAKWQSALSQRDDTIRQAGAQIQKLAQQRDDATRRANDLVAQFNRLASNASNSAGPTR